MPKYQREKSTDWVIVEGAAELELQELDGLYGSDTVATQVTVTALVRDCSFTNPKKGTPVDPRANYRRLTHPQWQWLREQMVSASLDEVADPLP